MASLLEIILRASGGDSVKGELGKVTSGADTATKIFGALGSMLSVGVLAKGIKDCITEFGKAEQAAVKLNSALRNQGITGKGTGEAFIKQAEDLMSLTTYTHEAITEGQALALNMGVQADTIKTITPLVLDFASAMGMDLETAFRIVGKAALGENDMLKRYGIIVDENELKTKGFNAVLETLQKHVSGTAELLAKSGTGQLKQFQNNLDELKETVGEALIPSLTDLLGTINKVTEALTGSNKEAEKQLKDTDKITQFLKDENVELWKKKHVTMLVQDASRESALEFIEGTKKEIAVTKIKVEISKEESKKLKEIRDKEAKDKKEKLEKEIKDVEELAEKKKQLYLDTLDSAMDVSERTAALGESLFELQTMGIENEKTAALNSSESKYKAEKDRIEKTVTDEKAKKELLASLEQSYAAEVENIKTNADNETKKRREALKPLMIAEATANTALGATKAFAEGGVLGFITAALVTAAGLVEVAKIQAQQFQGGGTIPGAEGTPVMIMAHGGEKVSTPQQQERESSGNNVYLTVHINGTLIEGDEAKWDKVTREHIFQPLQRLLKKTGQQFIG